MNKTTLYKYPCTDNNVSCHPIKFTLTLGVYQIELWGAGTSNGGGYTTGILEIKKELTLYAYIGGQEMPYGPSCGIGGYNGGGNSSEIGTFNNFCRQSGGSGVITVNNGNYVQAPFFHWEGVVFDNDEKIRQKKDQLNKYADFGVIEEEEYYEDYYSSEEYPYDSYPLRHEADVTDSHDSVGDLPSGGLFDKNNPKAAKILSNSPQIQAIDKMFGDSDNPLLDFLNQMPNMSTDDVISQLNNYVNC